MKRFTLIISAILLVAMLIFPQPISAGWVTDYKYRQKITIAGTTAGALTDYQMTLNVYNEPGPAMFESGWVDTGATFSAYNFPAMMEIDGTYFLYYVKADLDTWVSTSSSPIGPWTEYEIPAITKGVGKWDSVYVGAPSLIKEGDTYYLFYESEEAGGGYAIGYATSSNGYDWVKQTVDTPILDHGSAGTWDALQIGTPRIVKEGSTFYLTYHGHNGAASSSPRVGVAIASSITGPYTKSLSNPILSDGGVGTWDTNWVGARALFKYGTKWIMIYEGNSVADIFGVQCGIATSDDLITWTKDSANPTFSLEANGNPLFICEPVSMNLENEIYLLLCWPGTAHFFHTKFTSYGDRVVLNGDVQDDFDDIRFTTIDGTNIPYYVKSKTDGERAKVTIEMPSIPASPATVDIYVYWGKSDATSESTELNFYTLHDTFERGVNGDNVSTGSNWIVTQGSCTISTTQKYEGTRSCKLAAGAVIPKMILPSSYAPTYIQIRFYIGTTVNQPLYPIIFGYGGYAIYTYIVNGQDIHYYDTSEHDTGYNFSRGSWHIFEVRNINWTAHTYDLYYDTTKVVTANMTANSDYDNELWVVNADTVSGHDVYVDNVTDNMAGVAKPKFMTTSGNIDIILSSFNKFWSISMAGFSKLAGVAKSGMVTAK